PEPLPGDVPFALRLLVEKALEKEPGERYQSMRELVVDLRRISRARYPAENSPPALPSAPGKRWLLPAAALALAACLAAVWWLLTRPGQAWRNPLDDARFTRLTDFDGIEADAVISPDGNFVAFISDRDGPFDVWLLQISSGQFLNLTKGQFSLFHT